MQIKQVIDALGSLAQETRLGIFRLLVRRGAAGLPAGVIAERLGVPPATLSFHLAHLMRAGLIHQRRESRSLIYAANLDGMNALVNYLTENCCVEQSDRRAADSKEVASISGHRVRARRAATR
jgi:ArsR family transcriptional regulator, arsenate/arsenite/antimonite-responsive transcriptional repressor